MTRAKFQDVCVTPATALQDVIRGITETGKQIALVVDEALLKRIGLEGFIPSMRITCKNHLGAGKVAVNEWDARLRGWRQITDYYEPNRALIDPLIGAVSAGYAKKFGVARRDCN